MIPWRNLTESQSLLSLAGGGAGGLFPAILAALRMLGESVAG